MLLRAGTMLACANMQLMADGLQRGLCLDLKQWGSAAVQCQLYQMHQSEDVSHIRQCYGRGWISLPHLACPARYLIHRAILWKQIEGNNIAAPARKMISPVLMRTVEVMISKDRCNKEREAIVSLSVCRYLPMKECCFAGAKALLWTLCRRCHGLVSSLHPWLLIRSFVPTFLAMKRNNALCGEEGHSDFSCPNLNI